VSFAGSVRPSSFQRRWTFPVFFPISRGAIAIQQCGRRMERRRVGGGHFLLLVGCLHLAPTGISVVRIAEPYPSHTHIMSPYRACFAVRDGATVCSESDDSWYPEFGRRFVLPRGPHGCTPSAHMIDLASLAYTQGQATARARTATSRSHAELYHAHAHACMQCTHAHNARTYAMYARMQCTHTCNAREQVHMHANAPVHTLTLACL
jgi:hypothetical protein